MDFDLKIYIPLLGSCIVSVTSLIIGLINLCSNIKIKNQHILMNSLESDIERLIQIKKEMYDSMSKIKLIYIDTSNLNHENVKEFIYIARSSVKEFYVNKQILKEYSIGNNIDEILERFLEDINNVNDEKLIHTFISMLQSIIDLLDKEIVLKRNSIKNLLLI